MPVTVPYSRYSIKSAHWFCGRALSELIRIPGLKKHDIDYEEITAGEFKRTLTIFGENTEADRDKFREEIEDAHQLFKEFVASNRPHVDMATIATGEYWYGTRALERKLIDTLTTSDDYLYRRSLESDVFEVSYVRKRSIVDKILGQTSKIFNMLSVIDGK